MSLIYETRPSSRPQPGQHGSGLGLLHCALALQPKTPKKKLSSCRSQNSSIRPPSPSHPASGPRHLPHKPKTSPEAPLLPPASHISHPLSPMTPPVSWGRLTTMPPSLSRAASVTRRHHEYAHMHMRTRKRNVQFAAKLSRPAAAQLAAAACAPGFRHGHTPAPPPAHLLPPHSRCPLRCSAHSTLASRPDPLATELPWRTQRAARSGTNLHAEIRSCSILTS